MLGAMRGGCEIAACTGNLVCTWTTQGTCDRVLGYFQGGRGCQNQRVAAGQKWPPRRQNMHLGCMEAKFKMLRNTLPGLVGRDQRGLRAFTVPQTQARAFAAPLRMKLFPLCAPSAHQRRTDVSRTFFSLCSDQRRRVYRMDFAHQVSLLFFLLKFRVFVA
jgi:hypothetical protein